MPDTTHSPIRSKHFKKGTGKPANPGVLGFSRSKLHKSDAPIHQIVEYFRKYLHLPNPDVIYAVVGSYVANCFIDNSGPVWLMLVGPSGSGKTAVLKTLKAIDGMRAVGAIDSKAALLSGTKKKERSKEAKGGLLMELGDKGGLLWYEFTNILELPKETLKGILAALRDIYDGEWVRDVGGEGGTRLSWEGKIGIFAGVTNAIDRAHEFSSSMGERFVFWRLPETDGWSETYKALSSQQINDPDNPGGKSANDLMAEFLHQYMHALDLTWNSMEPRKMGTDEIDRIIALAQLAVKCRSGVVRDYQQREIVDLVVAESPMRFARIITKIFLGMEHIGVDVEDRWRVLLKIGLDSMPLVRRACLNSVMEKGEQSIQQLTSQINCSQSTIRRALEELCAHGVLVADNDSGVFYNLSPWAKVKMLEIEGKKKSGG